jgi:hypothetical protein
MALLEIDSLTPGMKVGKDVVEASGQVLLRTGTEITEKHLRVLRSWGIQQVEIEGPKPPDNEDALLARATPAMLDRAQASVSEHFHHTDPEHPAIAELMRLSILTELRHQVPPPPAPAA